ncbi:hypothetical protein PCANC_04618 [Puccinia coronata f. sp. avenae]|uniref:Endonuclease/exonuclease/phosphatase domain-containing protein n=1 Tax=Puccinia coronata f. sp. avenae TaxID=200324 RepID=A0A2N5W061_9BASI|nr:hypothetical protein PCANC_04618 [Puccinia coronata f. sp. avenae]
MTIRLINVYNTPRTFPAPALLNHWLSLHNSRSIPMFISMDANLHHPHWNPPGINSNHKPARDLLNICGKYGFRLASPRQVPTFYSKTGRGFTIDLLWANFLASRLIEETDVPMDNHGSDHQAIVMRLCLRRPERRSRFAKPNWAVISPVQVCEELQPLVDRLSRDPATPIEVQIQRLTDGVAQIQESLGRRVADSPHRAKLWWCKTTLNPIIDLRNRARKWFILTKSPEAAECY